MFIGDIETSFNERIEELNNMRRSYEIISTKDEENKDLRSQLKTFKPSHAREIEDESTRPIFFNAIELANIKFARATKVKELKEIKDVSTTRSSSAIFNMYTLFL